MTRILKRTNPVRLSSPGNNETKQDISRIQPVEISNPLQIVKDSLGNSKKQYDDLNRDIPVKITNPTPEQKEEQKEKEKAKIEASIKEVEAMRVKEPPKSEYKAFDSSEKEKEAEKEASKTIKFSDPTKVKDRKDRMLPRPTFNESAEFKNLFEGGKSYKASTDKAKIEVKKGVPEAGSVYGDTLQSHVGTLNNIFQKSGLSSIGNQVTSWMKSIDRFQLNTLPPNFETSDITLITRPTLPMESAALRHDSFLSMFDTNITDSMAFAIRCYLDKKWVERHTELSYKCPMFNPHNPWLVPAVNGLTSISSFPDPIIETKTTEGGYHQEDQIYAKGGTGLNRAFQITLNFKDIQGGPLLLMFQAWIEIMAQLRDGRIMAYMDSINANILPYTVGIYRFNLDPSKTYITNWCKVTTCFPLSVPLGAIMNTSENNRHISQSGVFSIPFACNFIHYNRLDTIRSFIALTERYYPFKRAMLKDAKTLEISPENNYKGVPFIEFTRKGMKFIYKELPEF